MKRTHLKDLDITLKDALKKAGKRGAFVGSHDVPEFALLPLDDDLIDYMMERSPLLIRELTESRRRTKNGERGYTPEEVAKEFGLTLPEISSAPKIKRTSHIPKNLASKKIA